MRVLFDLHFAPMKVSSILVLCIFAVLTFGLWAKLNKQTVEEGWAEERVGGFAFQPFRAHQDATKDEYPTTAEIEADLALLADRAINIRTYSTRGTMTEVPRLASKYHLQVTVGAWLYPDDALRTELELTNLLRAAEDHKNVIRLLVGNEVIYRQDMSVMELIAYLERIRTKTRKPVSTAEPWDIWMKNPILAEHVDYLAVHMLPYWENMPVEDAVNHIVAAMKQLQDKFPNKRIIIAEVGWPSDGRTRDNAVASVSNQALFLRRFIARAKQEGYVYYIMEAFDQPWKEHTGEGGAGAYWGVYDANRQPKFPFVEPIQQFPKWDVLAAISVVLAAILLAVFYLYSHTLRTRGRTFLAFVVYGTAIVSVWIIYDYSQQYL